MPAKATTEVSVEPTSAIPETATGVITEGAIAISAVAADVVVTEPALFVAVALTLKYLPESLLDTKKAFAVAPVISVHEDKSEADLHNNH